MNGPTDSRKEQVVPFAGLTFPDQFEVCWGGQSPFGGGGLSFGMIDGKVLFTEKDGKPLAVNPNGSASGEAISAIAFGEKWVGVSTRSDLTFWRFQGTEQEMAEGWAAPYGAHDIGTASGGRFIAAAGDNGIIVCDPDSTTLPLVGYSDNRGRLYAYRVICFRSQTGDEVIACAARNDGIAGGAFAGSREKQGIKTASFAGLDVVDVCQLEPNGNSSAVAALGRDGSIILIRDIVAFEAPVTMRFKKVKGIAYRIWSCRGELYVLTSIALYALGKLVSRFLKGELVGQVTQILTIPSDTVDGNLIDDSQILLILDREARLFDTQWIHTNVPEDVEEDNDQDYSSAAQEPVWELNDIDQTVTELQFAGS